MTVAELQQLMQDILRNGKIDGHELQLLREQLYVDGQIGRREADFLVEVHKKVQRVSPGFEQFFYQAIRDHIVVDGAIRDEEARWLRQMLSHDGQVTESEKKFLRQLKGEARHVSPAFQKLFDDCACG
jgi:hypothetical protein